MFDEIIEEIQQENQTVVKKIISGEGGIENRVDIEDVVLEIKRIERESEFLKELKQHRVASIDRRVKEGEQQIESLRAAILFYMQEKDETKLDFPDVAKVSTRNVKGSFEIEDDQKVQDHLRSLGVLEDVAVAQWKFDKRKLNKLLGELKDNNNLPQGVTSIPDRTSVTISFADSADAKAKEYDKRLEAAKWQKPATIAAPSRQDFDSLKI